MKLCEICMNPGPELVEVRLTARDHPDYHSPGNDWSQINGFSEVWCGPCRVAADQGWEILLTRYKIEAMVRRPEPDLVNADVPDDKWAPPVHGHNAASHPCDDNCWHLLRPSGDES